MKDFDTIWRFAIIGFLLAIVVQLGRIEKILNVPDIELPQYEESQP